jgi:hypothetical protein
MMLGRLKPEVSVGQAQAAVETIAGPTPRSTTLSATLVQRNTVVELY